MEKKKDNKHPERRHPLPVIRPSAEMVKKALSLSGRDALDEILDLVNPQAVVRGMVRSDFYWLVKRIGEDDALPLLRLASNEQWQHVLDMELWHKDRLDLDETSLWLGRLMQTDPGRLVNWLLSQGEALCYYYLFRNIEVEVRKGDEVFDLPEDLFTLDNLFYIRILDKENEGVIRTMLEEMSYQNYERYQALLLGLVGVLPAEAEEEMYRLRNVRLAEEGFLPFEEAVSAYTHMKAEALIRERAPDESVITLEEEGEPLIPLTPLTYVAETSLLAQSANRITDDLLLDRIRLEFAGLCNQILSAEGIRVNEVEVLVKACRKVAGYLNMGLEQVSRGDLEVSERLLSQNPLLHIFRVGFGLTLELQWEAEKWIKKAWFIRQDMKTDFWGDEWGGILRGILEKRPRLYMGYRKGESFGEFKQVAEIGMCRSVLRGLMALDRLFEILASKHPLERRGLKDPLFTFHALLFSFWARQKLGLEAGFEPLSLVQVRDLFRLLRAGTSKPPYEMTGFAESFIEALTSHAVGFAPEDAGRLRKVLSGVWEEFREEYAWVATEDLDGKYTRFIMTLPAPEDAPA